MYEHYEPFERVFVDREENLDWMAKALTRCKDQSIILHLRGIGGIGKTALIEHWNNSVETSILLDCSRATDFFDRLDALAKGTVRLGIRLRRFDLLWSIRLRFVQGVEPAKEPGRSWALTVIKPLPFIGSLVNIGKAIQTVGTKLRSQLKRRFGDIADWLQTRLGKDYSERLLAILWKEPRHGEMLFLDALLEDLNGRKKGQEPLLLLLDHFENVDSDHLQWRYSGRKISEAELWYEFFASLNNAVGVTASRRGLPKRLRKELTVEVVEITELDDLSCRELLTKRGITESELQTRIVSVSGGNPFVINTICDLEELGELSLEDIESLRAETLEEVRIKTWRRLFDQAEGLSELIDRAGLIPFFDRRIMNIVVPSMKSEHWDRVTRLSFVRDQGDGTWTLHSLAQELVIAELGDRLPELADEVAATLENAAANQSYFLLMGLALSAKAYSNEGEAITKFWEVLDGIKETDSPEDIELFHSLVRFTSDEGKGDLQYSKAFLSWELGRVAEADESYREAIRLYQRLFQKEPPPPDIYVRRLAGAMTNFSQLLLETGRLSEADDSFQEALQWSRKVAHEAPDRHTLRLAYALQKYAEYLFRVFRVTEAEKTYHETMNLYQRYFENNPIEIDEGQWVWLQAQLMMMNAHTCFKTSRITQAEEILQKAISNIREYEKPTLSHKMIGGWCLACLAILYIYTNRSSKAEKTIQEVISINRDLPDLDYPISLLSRMWYLNAYGLVLKRMNKLPEAEKIFQEVFQRSQYFSRKFSDYFQIIPALALRTYSIILRLTGNLKKAQRVLKESLERCRGLADQVPEQYLPSVSLTLTNLGVLLRSTRNFEKAEAALREALQIQRQLARKERDYFISDVATTLNILGSILIESNNLSDAEDILQEALQLRRTLSSKAPSFHSSPLASTLNNLGILHKRKSEYSEAEQAYQEAIEILERLNKQDPVLIEPRLRAVFINLAILLSETSPTGRETELIKNKLKKMEVEQIPKIEEWFEDEIFSHFLDL